MRKNFHIKKLYGYLLKTYIPLFLMTFAICLFLVLMQFLWKYVEDMVGKGLELSVIGEMFLYAALQLIPMALPLSILLASLMMFGNLGENLELLAIKSAGISLTKSMIPLIVLIVLISIGTFFFQNNAMPKIQPKFYSLLISIRQKSPELDIPEGVFYKEIQGYNLYVGKKNRETGMLYDVSIYDISSGFQNMAVIICDSAEMRMSEDKLSLIFTMHSGQQFQNFIEGAESINSSSEFIPYARESFVSKIMTISYDDNFNRMEESVLQENESSNYVAKNMTQLKVSIDSMEQFIDSINISDRKIMKQYTYLSFRNSYPQDKKDSIIQKANTSFAKLKMDSIFASKNIRVQTSILQSAYSKADNNGNDYLFRSMSKTTTQRNINRQWIEWHRKFTIPFACLIFFFIGAPLGSIVRKGGLGTPIVISVILFIIYYILDNIGYKMARDGVWEHWIGMWFSSMILLPLGIFLTYKAMNDSVILSTDTYVSFFKKLFFIRERRNYTVKEVVIEEPNYFEIKKLTGELTQEVSVHLHKYEKIGYKTYWMDNGYDESLISIKTNMENILNQLSNSRKSFIIEKAKEYPIFIKYVRPFKAGSIPTKMLMYAFPIGIVIKLLSLPFEKRINRDLNTILKLNEELTEIMNNQQNNIAV
ncbi:MAG: LptF/LptG family permease [Bacteroidia bacterium]|nr:LptF/LptG family permease [Bacteroidia bacterium]